MECISGVDVGMGKKEIDGAAKGSNHRETKYYHNKNKFFFFYKLACAENQWQN